MRDGHSPLDEDTETMSFRDRMRRLFLKPAPIEPAGATKTASAPASIEELEAAVRSADDKERLIGLIAAPFAAAIGILVISALITDDPAAKLKNGQLNPSHVSLALYHELGAVILVLSVLMLVTAMWRKRLYLGIVTALYGLAVFNLHYWGFGVPFVLIGAWYLVRAYRLQRDLREATEGGTSRASGRSGQGQGSLGRQVPKPNRRYTPPTRTPKRSSVPKTQS